MNCDFLGTWLRAGSAIALARERDRTLDKVVGQWIRLGSAIAPVRCNIAKVFERRNIEPVFGSQSYLLSLNSVAFG